MAPSSVNSWVLKNHALERGHLISVKLSRDCDGRGQLLGSKVPMCLQELTDGPLGVGLLVWALGWEWGGTTHRMGFQEADRGL